MDIQNEIDPIRLAEQICEQKKHEAEEWFKEQCSIIDSATEKQKKAIKKNYDEAYQKKKKEILSNLFHKFAQLMKNNQAMITQYATNAPELMKKFEYLNENNNRSALKMSHSSSYSEASPFDEDKTLIMKVLRDKGHDVDHMVVWSDGTLLHNGKFYTQRDVVKIRNRQNEIQLMKIDLITKTELVLEQDGEKLIISPDDLSSHRYEIL